MVCPPTFIATRQRCGGACREELGDLWVAFFLTKLQLCEVQMHSEANRPRTRCPSALQLSPKEQRIGFRPCNRFAVGKPLGAICSAPDSSGRKPWQRPQCRLRPRKQMRWHSENLWGPAWQPPFINLRLML